jgi:hypothetical protein
MKSRSLFIYSSILLTILSTTGVSAQLRGNTTTGTGASSANTNRATTGAVYNPVSSSDTKKTFSGTSFSSVGGAITGCSNAGGLILQGVGSLFKKQIDAAKSQALKLGQTVPVDDSEAVKALKKANRKQECLDGVAYAISKNLLQQVSNKTLNWINRGLDGNPLYVQDVASNLQTIRDEQLGRYLNTVQTSNPIFGNAIRSAITKQVTGISDGYIGVTMNTPEGRAYQAFQEDFTNGGWGALLNMKNNPIGAIFNSTNSISNQIATTQEQRVNEIQRNDGFLDMRTCVEYAPVLDLATENAMRTRFGYTTNTQPATPQCLRYKTVTPGTLISQQASNILSSPARQLEMADSINEVLGSFFDQLLSKLFQSGLSGLQTRGGGFGMSGGYGSNVILGSNGLPISGGVNSFGYSTIGTGYDVQDFDISRPQQLYAIIKAQYDFYNRATDSKIVMSSIIPTLGALDYCIPGPNPTWQNGLEENYQNFMAVLETPTKGRSTLATILSSIPILGGLFGTDDKEIQYALAGIPTLFDKTTQESVTISPWSYLYYTSDYARGVKNTDGGMIRGFINGGYERVIPTYQTNFTEKNIIDLFGATAADPVYNQGAIKNALKETANIISYNENLAPLESVYEQAISDTEDALIELEDIRAEANAIVKVAKARYIKERAALGNPVDMTCINRAYTINELPITGVARQESDIVNPMIQKSRDASDYFYSHL